jgi:hypothetical protein
MKNRREEDDMREIYRKDMKNYKAPEEAHIVRQVIWAIIAVVVFFAVQSKMAQDEESHKTEQQHKIERM